MNRKQVLENYKEALLALEKAQKLLDEIGSDWQNWSASQASVYAEQIANIISSNNGEDGVKALMDLCKKRLEQPKTTPLP